MSEERRVALGLGSNLGDRAAHLRSAVRIVSAAHGIAQPMVSAAYETDPVGGPEQASYLNAVLCADSTLTPQELLSLSQRCEQAADRVRAERWGPRTLDVDVLAVGDIRSLDPELTLPHPRALERAFVLVPWSEVDPGFVVEGRTVAERASMIDSSGVRRTDDDLAGVH